MLFKATLSSSRFLPIPVLLLGGSLSMPGFAPTAGAQEAQQPAGAEVCRTFVLRRAKAGVGLERVDVAPGDTKVFQAGPGSEIIDLVVPVGPGGSASLASAADRSALIVRCIDGALHVERRLKSGETSRLPAQEMSQLRGYDVRVNVTGGDGTRAAFLLRGYREAVRDSVAPIKNPFGEAVPLGQDDFVVFTETTRRTVGPPAYGTAPLEVAGHLFVPASVADGSGGRWIVDLAASSTLVSRSFLPEGTEVDDALMVEYSAAGKRLLKYAPSGATGTVTSVVGQARLSELQVGGIRFTDVDVIVLEGLPGFFASDVVGILGLDLLRRAPSLTLELTSEGGGRLELLSAEAIAAAQNPTPGMTRAVVELPFSLATHLFVRGAIEGLPVSFILDTGAPSSFVDAAVAEALGWTPGADRRRIRGLDEQGTDVWSVEKDLALGDRTVANVEFLVGTLPVLSSISLNEQPVGLLGISLLRRFARVEIDFESGMVRLYPASMG